MMPGVHDDVPNEQYHASEGISKTGAVTFDRCPALYRYGEKNSTRPQKLGSLFHCALLEPEQMAQRYHPVTIRLNPGDKAYKAAELQAMGRELISQKDYDLAWRMRDEVMKETVARELITEDAIIERSAAWIDPASGVLVRCRPDLIEPRMRVILDVKKCQDARKEANRRDIAKYRYHWAEAIYRDGMREADGWEPEAFVFLFIEEQPPFLSRACEIDPEDVSIARQDVAQVLRRYRDCLASDHWPRLESSIQRVQRLPPWAHSDTLGGPREETDTTDYAF